MCPVNPPFAAHTALSARVCVFQVEQLFWEWVHGGGQHVDKHG